MEYNGPPAPNCPQPRFRARDLHALFAAVVVDLVNSFTLAKGHGSGWFILQYRIYTTKRRGRLVRTPIPYIHHQETWSSGPYSNTVYTPPRDVVVWSVLQYRIYTTKRRGRLVRTPIPYIHHQETWSSGSYSSTVYTPPRDVVVWSVLQYRIYTLLRDVVVWSVLQYRIYTTKRHGRLIRTPISYIHE